MFELLKRILDWLASLSRPTQNATVYEEHRPVALAPAGLVLPRRDRRPARGGR